MLYVISVAALLLLLLTVALVRALLPPSAGRPGSALSAEELAPASGVEDDLVALVRLPTVSWYAPEREDDAVFASVAAELGLLYPRVHASLERELVGDRGILLTWKGSDPSLPPVILCSHFDVVPAEDAEQWKHAPFSGDLADGFVWGRGTQDIKVTLACALHAAERLLARGFRPRRSVYFAFGGDEEVGGNRGAGRIAGLLGSRGVHASFLLDEGGPISDGLLRFADRPVALVAVAEKGYLDVTLEVQGSGGHASMPPRRTVSGQIARAVSAVEGSPFPARLGKSVRSFLRSLARYCPLGYRLLFRNLWLSAPFVKAALAGAPATNALLRTTAAPTMLQGSPKENVLADVARANLNVRVLPGDTVARTLGRLGSLVARYGATVRPAHPEAAVEPPRESPTRHEGYRAIQAALAASFPEAGCAPFLLAGGTDTKHYGEVAEAVYRFTPLRQTAEEIKGVHGRDECVDVGNLRRCELFYASLIASL